MHDPGEFLSADKQDQLFTGKDEGKIRYEFKMEGDRSFMDSFHERKHTISFSVEISHHHKLTVLKSFHLSIYEFYLCLIS